MVVSSWLTAYAKYMGEHDTEPWKRDLDHYRQIGHMFCVIAEDHCQVPIDETTRLRWEEMMPFIMEVDTYLDERIVPGLNTEQDLVDELERFDRFRARYPHLAPEVLGEKKWRAMEQKAREVVDHFQALAGASTYEEYLMYRCREGAATAELFDVCASDEVRTNPAFEAVFMRGFRDMVVSGCLFDSAGDLSKDAHSGMTALAPTFRNRGRLFYDAVKKGFPHLDIMRHQSIRHELGQTALLYVDRHFKHQKDA
jgi:hypothetical protein